MKGIARIQYTNPECKHEIFRPFSCKRFYFCSSCSQKKSILFGIILVCVILGCFMEVSSVMILTLPIIFPIVQALQFDPIWFGVIMVIVLEIGLITPPIGLNVFILKGSAPGIPVETIFRGIWPFLAAALLAIVILAVFPQIALYIPSNM